MEIAKLVSIIFIVIVVLNFLLFVFGRTGATVFWAVTIACALAAYIAIPKIRGGNMKGGKR